MMQITTSSSDGAPIKHFLLNCYICGPGCTQPSPFQGWASFEQIYSHRPSGCRYAVAARICATGEAPFVLWDLLEAEAVFEIDSTRIVAPEYLATGGTSEGLIVKAAMLYEKL